MSEALIIQTTCFVLAAFVVCFVRQKYRIFLDIFVATARKVENRKVLRYAEPSFGGRFADFMKKRVRWINGKMTDPRNNLHHAQSPIALYTKVEAECNQQVTVVSRLLTTLAMSAVAMHVLITGRRLSLVYIALDDGVSAVAKCSESIVWDTAPGGSTVIFQISIVEDKRRVCKN